jgi:23S rRNA pseudouridine2605 synthase
MEQTNKDPSKERIAKRLAAAGVASRREVERMIEQGRVTVNGEKLTTPACLVGPADRITVDGKLVGGKPLPRVWRYHKPAGLVTTAKDPQGRATVFDMMPRSMGRVISVGRLDLNSEGLLLITNSGTLSRYMELPATGWKRSYRVRVWGTVKQSQLDTLKNGIEVEGIRYGAIDAQLEKNQTGTNVWLRMMLTEGKNREIRNVTRALDLHVNRLVRLTYGPFDLGDLKPGEIDEVPEVTVRAVFKHLL